MNERMKMLKTLSLYNSICNILCEIRVGRRRDEDMNGTVVVVYIL